MKTWVAWTLLVVGVIGIILFAYWLNSTLSVMTCFYITVTCNFIVSCYLILMKKGSKKS